MSTPEIYTSAMDDFMRQGVSQLRSTLSELIDVDERLEGILSKVAECRVRQESILSNRASRTSEGKFLIVPPEWAVADSVPLGDRCPSLFTT